MSKILSRAFNLELVVQGSITWVGKFLLLLYRSLVFTSEV